MVACRLLIAVLVLCGIAFSQTSVEPGGGGGSGTVNSGADQDLLCYQGAGTTVGPCSTAQILFGGSGNIVGATTGAAAMKFGAAGTALLPAWTFGGDLDTGIFRIGADNFGVALGGVQMASWGGGQTMRVWDQTATTGVTTLLAKGGAGQAATDIIQVQTDAGAVIAGISPTLGVRMNSFRGLSNQYIASITEFIVPSSYNFRFTNSSNAFGTADIGMNRSAAGVLGITDGSTGVGQIRKREENSALEPYNCASAVYGSTYFDTTDNRLCICVNDGTDDEWVKSDDYTHATGHCSVI